MISILQPTQPEPMDQENQPESNELLQEKASVKAWMAKIVSAKKKWEPDFERMRANMEFASGLQWEGQANLNDPRYVSNITLRSISQKVATLYAKNPTAEAVRRDRLDYQIWDGDYASLTQAISQAQMLVMAGQPIPPELSALFNDFQTGKAREALIDRVCKTLTKVYNYQVDEANVDFKEQMKQLVRRVCTTGVGWVKILFCSDDSDYKKVSTMGPDTSAQARTERIEELTTRLNSGEIDETSQHYQTLKSLAISLGASNAVQNEDDFQLPERLEFDFPSSTSVIIDPRCRQIKGLIGATWLAIEYCLPVEDVNAIFNVNVKPGTKDDEAQEAQSKTITDESKQEDKSSQSVHLYEVFDKRTKTRFFICKGWHSYIQAPEPPSPAVAGFWPVFGLTFNDVEVENCTKTSIYPPSDVQSMVSAQREWNRRREALRDHRNANAPKYVCRKGYLTKDDKEKLQNAEPNSVLELEGIPPESKPSDFIMPMQFAAVDPMLYDTTPQEMDIQLAGGMQQANIGPAEPDVTATVGAIAEQSRLTVSSSNIDDLDWLLTRLAKAGGEMLLQKMTTETVKRIVGQGAVWPNMPMVRKDFLNEIFLEVKAASSGRPNKAMDVQNAQQLVPLLLQAGANPVGVVELVAERLDDNIDLKKLFPLQMPMSQPMDGAGTPPSQDAEPSENPPTENTPQTEPTAPPAMVA